MFDNPYLTQQQKDELFEDYVKAKYKGDTNIFVLGWNQLRGEGAGLLDPERSTGAALSHVYQNGDDADKACVAKYLQGKLNDSIVNYDPNNVGSAE